MLKDPKLDVVRIPFLEGLSRLCLLLALGNLSCIVPLYLILQYHQSASPLFKHYAMLLTVVGILLTILGILCRYKNLTSVLPKICIVILFFQPCFFLYQTKSLQNPTIMFFPILCFLSTPILGLKSTYYMAGACIAAIFSLNAIIYPDPTSINNLSAATLLTLGIVFSTYISLVLWKSLLKREESLKKALQELGEKSDQIDQWAKQLAGASTLINDGSLTLALPTPPPHGSFKKLTENIGEMQKKISRYFSQTLIQDRLNSLGVLASGLAHELNTPLTSIRFLLETNQKGLPIEFLREIEGEVQRMTTITRDFLSYASPHQDTEVLNINDAVLILVPLLERIQKSNAKLVMELSPKPLRVKIVKTHLEQIILNLFKNSLDAAPLNKQLLFTITTDRNDDNSCLIKLQDNGVGMDRNILNNIFDPFYTTKQVGQGVGLGLYIVQEIIKSNTGSIGVQSEPGVGTTFTIRLPLCQETEIKKVA